VVQLGENPSATNLNAQSVTNPQQHKEDSKVNVEAQEDDDEF